MKPTELPFSRTLKMFIASPKLPDMKGSVMEVSTNRKKTKIITAYNYNALFF